MSYVYVINCLNDITNKIKVRKKKTKLFFSNFLYLILNSLKRENYIKNIIIKEKYIITYFSYKKKINRFVFISKPSKRVYINVKNMRKFKNQNCFISTNLGILKISEAEKLRVGGEILFCIY